MRIAAASQSFAPLRNTLSTGNEPHFLRRISPVAACDWETTANHENFFPPHLPDFLYRAHLQWLGASAGQGAARGCSGGDQERCSERCRREYSHARGKD